jgi:hypothetical protein
MTTDYAISLFVFIVSFFIACVILDTVIKLVRGK